MTRSVRYPTMRWLMILFLARPALPAAVPVATGVPQGPPGPVVVQRPAGSGSGELSGLPGVWMDNLLNAGGVLIPLAPTLVPPAGADGSLHGVDPRSVASTRVEPGLDWVTWNSVSEGSGSWVVVGCILLRISPGPPQVLWRTAFMAAERDGWDQHAQSAVTVARARDGSIRLTCAWRHWTAITDGTAPPLSRPGHVAGRDLPILDLQGRDHWSYRLQGSTLTFIGGEADLDLPDPKAPVDPDEIAAAVGLPARLIKARNRERSGTQWTGQVHIGPLPSPFRTRTWQQAGDMSAEPGSTTDPVERLGNGVGF